MDEWKFDILRRLLELGFNSRPVNNETTGEAKHSGSKQTFCGDDPLKTKKRLIYGIGQDGTPYPKYLEVTTYHKILEGDNINENTEAGEIAIGELENQTSNRREEILSNEADKG